MKIEVILNRWLAIKAKKDDLKKEEEKIKKLIDNKLGENDKLDVSGYRFIREKREIKKYNIGALREVITDGDALSRCLIPDNRLVKIILKEQEVPKDKIQYLEENMDIQSESKSIKLVKINTQI